MKPCMHLVEIIRPTNIMNRADQNWTHFLENKVFKKEIQKHFLLKVGLLIQYSSKEIKCERFIPFSTLQNDFESQNFEMFKEVVHSFGKSDGDIV